jgi:hypothetical protein
MDKLMKEVTETGFHQNTTIEDVLERTKETEKLMETLRDDILRHETLSFELATKFDQ